MPGAVADNLTSYGGRLDDSKGQTSILSFISAGATGSFGTVSEPCAFAEKFPDPATMIDKYSHGQTLLEAYWKSVSQTFQGLFIGDPLANPYEVPANFDTLAPSSPTDLVRDAYICPTSDSINVNLKWHASTDNFGVVGYNIYKNFSFYGRSNTTSFLDTGVAPHSSIRYTVTAIDAAGNESPLNDRQNFIGINFVPSPAGACTPDFTPPSTPKNLVFLGVSCPFPGIKMLSFSWDSSTDNIEVAGYNIYQDGQFVTTSNSTHTLLIAKISSFASYQYSVSAIDPAGNESPQSTSISVKIPDLSNPSVCVRGL